MASNYLLALVTTFALLLSSMGQSANQQSSYRVAGPMRPISGAGLGQPQDAQSPGSTGGKFVSEQDLDAYAAACARERVAADQWSRFKGAVLEDQNKIRALGFDRTSQQFEHMGENASAKRCEFIKDLAGTALSEIEAYTKPLSMSRTTAVAYKNLFEGRAPQAAQTMSQVIGRASGDIVHLGNPEAHEVFEGLDHVWDGINRVDTNTVCDSSRADHRQLADTFKNAADLAQLLGVVGPWAALTAPTTDVAELVADTHELNQLTKSTDAKLNELKTLTGQLKADTSGLSRAHTELTQAQSVFSGGSCDSTKLVKKEPTAPEQAPPTSSAAVSPSKASSATAKSHTGLIVGGVLAGAGVAGAAAAYGLKNQSQSSQSCQAPEHCNALSPGPPGCTSGQDFLNALNAYCQCAGFPSGHDLGAGASCP